jgi:hypothetical protein
VGVPETEHGLPSDTTGRYGRHHDKPASYRDGASCRRAACVGGRRIVTSQRRAREQGVIMICCRRAAACAVTVRAEATARQVNIAPSPVSGNCDRTVSARLPLCMSFTIDPVQARWHETKSRRRTRTEPDEEDFRSVAFQAPMCALFNISPGPPVGTPLNVRAPFEPIKGRARALEHKSEKALSSRSGALSSLGTPAQAY